MEGAQRSSNNMNLAQYFLYAAVVLLLAAAVALPKLLKALYLLIKHGSVASSMEQIGKAVLKSLFRAHLIQTDITRLRVVSSAGRHGVVSCSLEGATSYERSLFIQAMSEVLGPIENPRYILVRKTPLGRFIREDYHVVPDCLGRKKELAEFFMKMWAKYVGPTKLIYTRSVEGRRLLLTARGHSMSSAFLKRSERISVWK